MQKSSFCLQVPIPPDQTSGIYPDDTVANNRHLNRVTGQIPANNKRVSGSSKILASLGIAMLSMASNPMLARAINANPNPGELTQPDGTRITLRLRGDEWFNWLEDLQGYTVVLERGRYVYATLDTQGLLAPTGMAVGQANPDTAGLTKGLLPTPQLRSELRDQGQPSAQGGDLPETIPAHGSVKNLVILCKFSDHVLGTHTRDRADYDVLFNAVGGHPEIAPTGSVKDYFTETSYGTMTLNSTVLAWVTLPETEAYYAAGSCGIGKNGTLSVFPQNSQGMVRDALALVDDLVNFADFDTDNDGYVDAIDIIHSGYGAETLGNGYLDRIWSHRWNLAQSPGGRWTSGDLNAFGVSVKVYDYHTEAALWGTSGTQIVRIGVICHETGHFFGLPDLYDGDGSSSGVGSYCLMANSWGFDFSQLHPPHLSAWCKVRLGWVMPTVIGPGNYTAPQVETSPTIFRINSGYPSGEYLLVENRQKVGFENNMPQGGLAVWHIDEAKPDNKQEGYPEQAGWPGNGNHYKVALLQADGLHNLEHSANRGDGGDLYRGGGVSAIGADTMPNTHAYQNGIILVTSNRISVTSPPGANMTFTYSRATAALPSIAGFNPISGPVGANVVIAGANFTGATAVQFNGVNATFTVNTSAQITALIPAGATTGPITVITAGGTAISATSFTVIGASPVNDDLANARVLIGGAGTAGGDNSAATKEPGEPNHAGNAGGKSVWYYWTSPASGPMTMDTAGSGFNTLLGVYTGDALGALSLIASNDDTAPGTQSRVSFEAAAGTVYRIAVDGFNGASGAVVLKWVFNAAGNDNFIASQVITGTVGSVTGNNSAATKEPGEPNHAGNVGGKSVWYYWTAPSSGHATVDTVSSSFDTLLGVYTGSDVGALSLVASSDDIFGGITTQSQVDFAVLAGATYRIAVDGYNGAAGGVVLNWVLSTNAPSIGGFAPNSGQAGTNVVISGVNFTAATSVRFNGTSASYTVNNATHITATVPAGASTGPISVTAPGGTATSLGIFTVTSGFNDHFTDGQVINGAVGRLNGSTVGATKEFAEPNHAGNAGGRSIWYSWTAPASGQATVDTVNSGFDTLLAVYSGNSVGALTPIASNDDITSGVNQQSLVTFAAVAGTTYRITVDGFDGAFGNVFLNWTLRPGNDDFANGLLVSGKAGSFNGSTVGATKEPGEPNHSGNVGGKSVWYYWMATNSGFVTIDTGGSSFDTVIGVYTGTSVEALVLIASNDDYRDRTSLVNFPVTPGTTYRIAVDGFNGNSGGVVLNWSLVFGNDNFANSQVITGSVGTVTGNNTVSTKEFGEPIHAGNAGGRSIWYSWTAPGTGLFTIHTAGSSFDTLLGVYTGSSVGALSLVSSNDDTIPGINQWSRVNISAVAGTVYWIAVDGFDGNSGNVVLNWSAAPGNDHFANGQVVSGSAGSVNGSNLGATREANEPDHAANAGGSSIWYYWTAPKSGPATIDTQGSSFDTLLAVYTGTSVGTLALIASNDDTETNIQSHVKISAVSGATYRIAIDGYGGTSGSIMLNIHLQVPSLMAGSRLPDGQFQFQLTGPIGSNYVVEASLDLTTWTPIVTNLVPAEGSIPVIDPYAMNYSQRFYRAVSP